MRDPLTGRKSDCFRRHRGRSIGADPADFMSPLLAASHALLRNSFSAAIASLETLGR